MPIIRRTPQYDPTIDEYPVAQQALQTGFGLANLAQNQRQLDQADRRLDLAEQGQNADIANAQARLELWREEAARAQEQFRQQQELNAGLAQAADLSLGGTPGIQGPPSPMGMQSGYDDDMEIEGVRFAAQSIKSDQARALFLQQAGEDLKEKRVQRQTQQALGKMSSAMRSLSATPGMEDYVQRLQMSGQMLDAAAGLPPKLQGEAIDAATQTVDEVMKLAEQATSLRAVQGDALTFFEGLAGQMPPGSPLRAKMAVAGMAVNGMDDEDSIRRLMVDMLSEAIGYDREAEKLAIQREALASRERIEQAKLAARERQPIGMQARGISASTVKEQAEQLLGYDPKTGKAKLPKLDKDGKQMRSEPNVFGFGGGELETEDRPPTDAEWAEAMARAGQMLRGGIGVEGIPQNQFQPLAPQQQPAEIPSFEEWLKMRGK